MMSAKLPTDERLPLYQRLRDAFQTRIASGEWKPGGPIPTEAELTREYGVAIGTIRKAVDTLVSDGLLQRSQGRGTFVRRPDFESSFLRFFRQTSTSGERITPEGQVLARSLAKPPQHVRQALQLDAEAQGLKLDRLRKIDGNAIFREEIWLPHGRFQALENIPLEEFDNLLYPFYESQCGQLIASATETLSVSRADARTAKMLGIEQGSPVVIIDRTALGYDRTPLEYRRSWGSADTFHYRIDIS
ncbi:GntR family transcriptional regulator [Halomonas binhaiensis]|nr:GntR family transcriptional regulator [Halomonas binhaiensis]